MKKTGIIIVNFNGEAYLNDCIESLYKMKYSNFNIIIVDCASSDKSIEGVENKFSEIIILKQNKNVGYAKGCNIGIKYCLDKGFEYILLINNDIEVDEYLLSEMIEKANNRIIVAPKIYYFNKKNILWYAGGELKKSQADACHWGKLQYDNGEYSEDKYVSFASGCCLLIHRDVFKIAGFFDEKYFMYFEDTDFCTRLIQYKINILYVHTAILWHKVGASSGGEVSLLSTYYINRNKLYYLKKNKNLINNQFVIFFVYSKLIIKWICSIFYKKHNRIINKSVFDFLYDKMGYKELEDKYKSSF